MLQLKAIQQCLAARCHETNGTSTNIGISTIPGQGVVGGHLNCPGQGVVGSRLNCPGQGVVGSRF